MYSDCFDDRSEAWSAVHADFDQKPTSAEGCHLGDLMIVKPHGTPWLATIHPTGARMSNAEFSRVKDKLIELATGAGTRPSIAPIEPAKVKAGAGQRSGAPQGAVSVGPEFFEPLPEEELAAWE